MPVIKRTQEEIDVLLNEVQEQEEVGGSRFPGMSYEQGVNEAIRWLLGESDDYPYPAE